LVATATVHVATVALFHKKKPAASAAAIATQGLVVPGMSAYGFSVLFQHRPSDILHRPNGGAARGKQAKALRQC